MPPTVSSSVKTAYVSDTVVGVLLDIPVTGIAAAGSTLVVEFNTPDGEAAGHSLFVGSNQLGEASPTYLYAPDCGAFEPTPVATLVLPDPDRQAECIRLALNRAKLNPADIDIVSTHATGTSSGDVQEVVALRQVFDGLDRPLFNNTKSFIGHAMGGAGALELAGNLGAFADGVCHPTINLDQLDADCELPGLVANESRQVGPVDCILNNSFGMLGINSVVIVKKV